jgi:acyl-CoA thioesterase FadM
MSSPDRLEPSFYRHWIEDRVRFADLDPLGHCNNAAIGGFFESSRIALFADAGHPVSGGALSIPIVRTEIDFRHEVLYGARVRVGARVLRIGRTSFTLAGEKTWKDSVTVRNETFAPTEHARLTPCSTARAENSDPSVATRM